MRNILLAVPPLHEQMAIAAFLDRETAKIDAMVEEQQRLIALLEEKRQAVISHAVTKGVDTDAPMKDSGVEWLGEVPAHWTVIAARRLISAIEQGWSPECENRCAEAGEWGILKTGCVNRGEFRESENKVLPAALDPILELEVQIGDVLMSRANGSPELVGSTAYVNRTRPGLILSDKTFRISPSPICAPRYFVALFNSAAIRLQIRQAISGADGLANNLPQSRLKAFVCPLPPPNEQRSIMNRLDRTLPPIVSLIEEAETAIALLQERRNALISAAVTGKIDVRGLAPQSAEAA